MRYLFPLVCGCALSVFPLIGCSDSDGAGGTGGVTGGTGGDGGAATAELRLFVQSWEPGGATGALPGVEVCELDTENCVTTDEGGNAVIRLPAEQETAVTLVKEGFGKYVDSHIIPTMGAAQPALMATDERFAEMHELVESPYPMEGTGTPFVNFVNSYEGATLALVGEATGIAWYRDEDQAWDAELTATTSGGGGGFSEVAPGVVQIDIGEANCTVARGWAGDADNRVKLPVKEGFLSRVDVRCEAP